MTVAEIRAELRNAESPLASAYQTLVSAGDDQGIADLLNAANGAGAGTINRAHVTRGELVEALVPVSGLKPLYAAAANTASPVFDFAKAATLILDNPGGELNYSKAGTRALVAALGPGAAGLLSADQLSALVAACTRIGSRAEVLWGEGESVRYSDVVEARNDGNA